MHFKPERRPGATAAIVGRRMIYEGWNSFEIVDVEERLPDGTVLRSAREVIDHGEASVVLTYDPERQVALLARQLRTPLLWKGLDAYPLEACAGIMEKGETPEECAIREAEEELGLRLTGLKFVQTILPSAGTLTERMHLFLATYSGADRASSGGGNAHEGEAIEIVEMPLAELFAAARRGEIADAKTLVLVYTLLVGGGAGVTPEPLADERIRRR
ncbi:NUDIX domain-containing protein [Propylenella binzhouense]|uniref:GDP-mannose pyrophosphatase n=1 Tax=Propylenella binzhouense TaxID=2555902 RepID=A0A964T6S1_9HYPH|nr:NUDIX hydrolase [Propylenella binzhouense]MYZ48869.1 NUDIX hydrolase [Propylenella binzhouense]